VTIGRDWCAGVFHLDQWLTPRLDAREPGASGRCAAGFSSGSWYARVVSGVLKRRFGFWVLAASVGAGSLASSGSACATFGSEPAGARDAAGEAAMPDGGDVGEAATPDGGTDPDPCKAFVAPVEQTGLVDCGGPEPVNLNDTRAHCGACGHSCGARVPCIAGICDPAAWQVGFSNDGVVRVLGARAGSPIALVSHPMGLDAGAVFALAADDGGNSPIARLQVEKFSSGALQGDDLFAFSTNPNGVIQVDVADLAPDASAPNTRRSFLETDRARAAITDTELIFATGKELRSLPRVAGSDAGTRTQHTSASGEIVSLATARVEGSPIFYVANDGDAGQTQTLYRFTAATGSKAVLTASGLADLAVDAQYVYFFNAVERAIRRIALSSLTSIGAGFVADVGLVVQAGDPVADAGYGVTERRRFEVRGDHVYFFALRADNAVELKRVHRCGGASFSLTGPIDPVSLAVPEGDYAFYTRRGARSESIMHRVAR
jgi:hypothetical protein